MRSIWPIVGWSDDRLRIHGTSRFSNMPLSGVCSPVTITERDEVHIVAGHWWLVKVTPLRSSRSWPGSDRPAGQRAWWRSWSVKMKRMLRPLRAVPVAVAGLVAGRVCARAEPMPDPNTELVSAAPPDACRKPRRIVPHRKWSLATTMPPS